MFDDLDTAEQKTEKPSKPAKQRSSWWIGRWAHVIAGLVFCVLYFPFDRYAWSWQVAATVAYIVFMLCCTCGLSFKDSDDFFGNFRVPEYMATLFARQILVLALVSAGAWIWHRLIPILPSWATQGPRLPLWDLFGIILFYLVAVKEASWMAAKIKSKFPELEDSE